jgi:hypothetical protein
MPISYKVHDDGGRRPFGLRLKPGVDYDSILRQAGRDRVLAEPVEMIWKPDSCRVLSSVSVSPLLAAMLGRGEVNTTALTRRLITRMVPPDLKGPSGLTALHFASGSDNSIIAEILLERGADPTALVTTPTGECFSSLQLAVLNADHCMISILRAAGARVDGWFLNSPGGRATAALFLTNDHFAFAAAVPQFPDVHYKEPEQKWSWMELACIADSPAAVACLLDIGWRATTHDLEQAVLWSQGISILELLVSAGAIVWAVGGGPLTLACCGAEMKKVQWLLDHGANPNEGLMVGCAHTPLDMVDTGWGPDSSPEKRAVADLIRKAGGVHGPKSACYLRWSAEAEQRTPIGSLL